MILPRYGTRRIPLLSNFPTKESNPTRESAVGSLPLKFVCYTKHHSFNLHLSHTFCPMAQYAPAHHSRRRIVNIGIAQKVTLESCFWGGGTGFVGVTFNELGLLSYHLQR